MRHKRLVYLSIGLVVALALLQVLPWWLGRADFAALQNKSEPRFSRRAAPPSDGGSIHYKGFGYTLWNLHRLTSFGMGRCGLIVGPKIEYWFPFGLTENREDTKTLDRTEEWGWGTEPADAANGSPPVRAEINRTSSAAAPE